MPFIARQMIDECMFMLDIFLSDVVADDRDHIIDNNIECWHIGNDIDIMLLVRTWILVFLLMIMCGFFSASWNSTHI